jgi:hypothetical protein
MDSRLRGMTTFYGFVKLEARHPFGLGYGKDHSRAFLNIHPGLPPTISK